MPDWFPELLAAVLAGVIAITLHEAAHGYAALGLGDDTAKRLGRLSINPIRHVDPVGTLLVPGILIVTQLLAVGRVDAMFGWAKPVPVNILNLRNPRTGMMWVALAGPATNFFLALFSAFLVHAVIAGEGSLSPESAHWLYRFLGLSILANLVLGLFNLIPVPPLDGGRIAVGLLPERAAMAYARTERFGLLLVIGVLFLAPMAIPAFQPMQWFLDAAVRPAFNLTLRAAGIPAP
ncbi:MAG: site-2 protease family protein [Acetobacteraceae bacterium]|nr:site-2 protease family protein [Acetobacteraceae bacterium]